MDIQICIEYFDFLRKECDKYLSDNIVSEDEFLRIQNELNRIKMLVHKSIFSFDLKNQIEELELNYEISRKTKLIKLLEMILFRSLSSTYHIKKMKESIIEFRPQVLDILLDIKTI